MPGKASLIGIYSRGSLLERIWLSTRISATDKGRCYFWYFRVALSFGINLRVPNTVVYCGTDFLLMFFFEAKLMFRHHLVVMITSKLRFYKLLLRVVPSQLTLPKA